MRGEFQEAVGGLLTGFVPGARVGGYRLEEQVGAGGMAVVFRAVDERLGRQVALKILAPALASDEAFRQRFIRESRVAAAVDDPHIIPVHEAGEASGVLFIAMRYVPGRDARTLLHRQGPLSAGRAAAIISAVASALDAAHAAGLVHRDVKPANMLVDVRPDRPDHVYLSDFGISKQAMGSAGLTKTGQYLGTPDYIAPEQIDGKPVDGRADQYALGCAAFELLTGQPPYQRDDPSVVIWAHMSAQPPLLTSFRKDLPEPADQVFARVLAKNPADRYPCCLDFAEALRAALALAPYHDQKATPPGSAAGNPPTEIAEPSTPAQDALGPDTRTFAPIEDAKPADAPGPPEDSGSSPPRGVGIALPSARRRKARRASTILAIVAGVALLSTALIVAVGSLRSASLPPVLRPTGLSAGPRSYTTAQIYWSGPRSGPAPGRYVIFQDGLPIGSVHGGTTTYRVTGLTPGTEYEYQVLAVRDHRRSPLSHPMHISTLTTPPVSGAVLTGPFTVRYSHVTWYGTSNPALTPDHWRIIPDCPIGPCSAKLQGTFEGWSFTTTLRREGRAYIGTATVGKYLSCNDVDIASYLTYHLQLSGAVAHERQWQATSWTGSLALYSPATSDCNATGINARINGRSG